MEMRLPSGYPRAALATSSPRQLEVHDRQPRSLGEMLIVDQQDDLHDGALGATLRELLQPQVGLLCLRVVHDSTMFLQTHSCCSSLTFFLFF